MERRLRISIDNLREGVQVIDRDWRYVYVNKAGAEHGQRSAAMLIGHTMQECYPDIEGTTLFATLRRVMQERQPEVLRYEFVYPSGERRWFDLAIEPVPEGLCVLSLDVTERVRTEEDLRHVQRLDLIGRLAGGVAHDFNNQLTAILGFADLLLERIPAPEDRRDIETLRAAAARSASLTQQLLIFSRRQRLEVGATDLNRVVESVVPLLRRTLGSQIRLDVALDRHVPPILGDAHQLENALTNLAINARDAMPRGGVLRIQTAHTSLGEEDVRQHPSMQTGHYAVLTVSDTGHGMGAATRERIFEPFFSTKEAGHGTGLGLSLVYGLVKQMGGFVWVYSEPGRGATFRLYFPATAGAPLPRPAPPPRRGTPARARIVVIEDDPGVRAFVARALAAHGHEVFAATTVEEARRHMEARTTPPDLVIADVMLPGGTGPELLADLPIAPGNVLFMSGYSYEQLDGPAGEPPARLLGKPFTVAELLQAVGDRLAADEPRPPAAE